MAREARDEMDRFNVKGRELEVVFAQERRKTPNEMRGKAGGAQAAPPGPGEFERSSSFERHRQRQRDEGRDRDRRRDPGSQRPTAPDEEPPKVVGEENGEEAMSSTVI